MSQEWREAASGLSRTLDIAKTKHVQRKSSPVWTGTVTPRRKLSICQNKEGRCMLVAVKALVTERKISTKSSTTRNVGNITVGAEKIQKEEDRYGVT